MTEQAYPLQWPEGWPRCRYPEWSQFKVSFARARDDLIDEIRMLGGKQTVISTNLKTRQDGYPLASQREPEDAGVAVYFTYKGKPMCFACDRFCKVHENMRAIGMTIEALRGIERWGASDMLDRAFTGFAALNAPEGAERPKPWWEILGVGPNANEHEIEYGYRKNRKRKHPDHGGTPEEFIAVKKAYETGKRERGYA